MATITKTQEAQPLGTYVPTSVDAAREAADIRIVDHGRGNRTYIETRKLLSGPGIKLIRTSNGTGRYQVTEEAMTELRRRYSVATDF
jgi:hypothetical protein